jgi:AcrR family transcriptional regulator
MTNKGICCAEPARGEVRRAQVLDAAEKCFRRSGFHGASMAEIAKTAGMSVGHVYHYLESKEAIIAAIVQRDLRQVLALLDDMEGADGELIEKLVAKADVGVKDCLDVDRTAIMLEVTAEASRNPKVAAMVRDMDGALRRHLRSMLERAYGAAGLSTVEIDGRIEVMFALFQGAAIRAIRNPDLDRASMIASMKRAVRAILAA